MGVRFHSEGNILTFVLEGESTAKQAEKVFFEALGNPDDHRTFQILVDASASQRNRTLSEVLVVAESLMVYRERIACRCALVINDSRVQSINLERCLAGLSLREKLEFGLFFDLGPAKKWLMLCSK